MMDANYKNKQELQLLKPASWMNMIQFINHLALLNQVMVAVQAEKQGGKTAFMHLLKENLDPKLKSSFITATAPFDSRIIINHIIASFHLNGHEYSPLSDLVKQINEREAPVLLVIDDAHLLSSVFLRTLIEQIETQDLHNFFHLCLIGDYSIESNIRECMRDEHPDCVHTVEMGVLNETETTAYLAKKLSQPEYKGIFPDNKAIKKIFNSSGGNIAQINEALHGLCAEHRKKRGFSLKKSAIRVSMAASVAAAVIAGVFVYEQHLLIPVEQPDTAVIAKKVEEGIEHLPTAPVVMISELPSLIDHSVRVAMTDSRPRQVVLAMLDEDELMSSEVKPVVDSVVVIPKITRLKSVDNPVLVSIIPALPIPKQPIAKPKSVAHIKPKSSTKDVQALYTVQLAATHQLNDLKAFIKKNHISHAKIRSSIKDNEQWYVLTVGEFSTVQEAKNALKEYQALAGKYQPWIRHQNKLKDIG